MNATNATVLDAIGNTPLVEIRRMNPNPRVKLLAKLEYVNPGGSIKDRPALYMIEAAERSGELTRDKIVVEATSGNTGIGLAMVCAVKGYRLLLAMSESVSVERQRILKARGAEILLTPGHLGTDGAIEEVYRLVRENPGRYFAVDQFNNPANWQAHYHGTAEEIWRQAGGAVDVLVATMGTTGTLMGVSRRLKEYNPVVRIVGVEPYLGHRIQGLKNLKEAYCPEIFEKQRLDEKVNIEDEEAYETARRLAREEGLLVGMSSGAALAAAVKEAGRLTEGTLVVILPDGGERYLSTPLFATQEAVDLNVYNLLSRSREKWEPLKDGRATVYTCGPRLQRPLQLSEARRFVLADLLCRYLRWRGLAVKQAVDVMDLEEPGGGAAEGWPEEIESRRLLDGLPQHPVTLSLSGFGEPLVHPDILTLVRLAREQGARVEIITNGMLLDAALELPEQLLALGREDQRIGAPIGGRGAALDQIARFQLVDHGDHGGAVELGGGGEQALRHARVGGNQDEHAETPRRDVEVLQLGGEIAENGELGEAQLVADQAGQKVELEIGFRPGLAFWFFLGAHRFRQSEIGCGLYSIGLRDGNGQGHESPRPRSGLRQHHSTVGIAFGAGRGQRGALSRPPHLLRRPQLRRACARNGRQPGTRAAVLFHEAGRGRRHGWAHGLSADDCRPAARGRAGGGAGLRRPRHSRRRGAGLRLRLRRRPRHDAARRPGRAEGQGPLLGDGQGLRPIGADLFDRSGRPQRPSAARRHRPCGE